MNFSFDVNDLFKEEITILDNMLQCCPMRGALIGRESVQLHQKKIFQIVDKMGEASAKSQGLHNPVTSSQKMALSNHRLYIMKDVHENRSSGSVVGLLKVGTKNLFVYDSTKVQHELQPLCVLDFYIHESKQRMGCGLKLFNFMLEKEQTAVQHLAFDRPSPKLLSFLAKHYNLQVLVPQVNNFVVYDTFFYNRSDLPSVYKLQLQRNTAKHVHSKWMLQNNLRENESSHLGASQRMYSRHSSFVDSEQQDSIRKRNMPDNWSVPNQAHHNSNHFSFAQNQISSNINPKNVSSLAYAANNSPDSVGKLDLRHSVRTRANSSVNHSSIAQSLVSKLPNSFQEIGKSSSELSSKFDEATNGKQGIQYQEHHSIQKPGIIDASNNSYYDRNDLINVRNNCHVASEKYLSQPKTPSLMGQTYSLGGNQSSKNRSWTVSQVLSDQQFNAQMSRSHDRTNCNLWG